MEHVVISPGRFVRKCKSLAAAKNIYLDVVEGRVRLVWTGSSDGAAGFMERAEVIGLGISYDMILDALSESGEAIDTNGRYPINVVIRRRLRRIKSNCARPPHPKGMGYASGRAPSRPVSWRSEIIGLSLTRSP